MFYGARGIYMVMAHSDVTSFTRDANTEQHLKTCRLDVTNMQHIFQKSARGDITSIHFMGSSVSIVTRLRAGRQELDSRQGQRSHVSLCHRLQNVSGAHPDFCPMGIEGSFPESKAAAGVKLTTHLHIMPRLRIL
jgi:hypothetical protein